MARTKKLINLNASIVKNAYHKNPFNLTSRPYTDTDYQDYELAWRKTMAGNAIDTKIAFILGKGVKPVFELLDDKGMKPEAITKALEKYDKLKQMIIDYENSPLIRFPQQLKNLTTNAKVFGRGVLAFEPPESEKQPIALKIVHPRDLGEPIINEDTWQLEGVKIGNGLADEIASTDMIYLVNRADNPIKDNTFYGFSDMERINGASKALRRLMEFDAPEIAESMWANYGIFLVDTEGLTEEQARARIDTLLNGLKAGGFMGINAKKDQITWMPAELKANLDHIIQLGDAYERNIIGNFRIPAPLLGREEEANMATLLGKIRLFMAGPVQEDRDWLSDTVSEQWYKRLVQWMEPEALKTIRVKCEFENTIIEEWSDIIDSLQKLKQTLPSFPDKGVLELAGLEQYKDELDEKAKEKAEDQKTQVDFFNKAKGYLEGIERKKKK